MSENAYLFLLSVAVAQLYVRKVTNKVLFVRSLAKTVLSYPETLLRQRVFVPEEGVLGVTTRPPVYQQSVHAEAHIHVKKMILSKPSVKEKALLRLTKPLLEKQLQISVDDGPIMIPCVQSTSQLKVKKFVQRRKYATLKIPIKIQKRWRKDAQDCRSHF